jgi:hypothetical protein
MDYIEFHRQLEKMINQSISGEDAYYKELVRSKGMLSVPLILLGDILW